MRVFVTGASGHIGQAVVGDLTAAGHEVVGLARSDEGAERVRAAGAEVHRGDINDPRDLAEVAAQADGVIHLAFDHAAMQVGDLAGAAGTDLAVVTAIGDALAGTGKPFITTSGTFMIVLGGVTGRPGLESDVLPGGYRIDSENAVIELAQRGVRSSAIRLAPLVHSHLDHHGFGPTLIAIAREQGYAAYIGAGANRWPGIDTRDAARLYRLAVEKAPAGTRLHGVADEGVPFREIAEAIGRGLDVPVRSVGAEQAPEYFGFLAPFAGLDGPVENRVTRELLGWEPEYPGLIADYDQGHYFQAA